MEKKRMFLLMSVNFEQNVALNQCFQVNVINDKRIVTNDKIMNAAVAIEE